MYSDFLNFFVSIAEETAKAKEKFPSPDGLIMALMEECGELAKALADESRERVFKEAVQVAAMAARLAIEGDPTINHIRQQRGTPE